MVAAMLQMTGATPLLVTIVDGFLLLIDAQWEYTDGVLLLPGGAES